MASLRIFFVKFDSKHQEKIFRADIYSKIFKLIITIVWSNHRNIS